MRHFVRHFRQPGVRWGVAGWRAVIDPAHVAAVALAHDLEADLIDRLAAAHARHGLAVDDDEGGA